MSVPHRAPIFQHPSSPVTFDPPAEPVPAALEPNYTLPTADEFRVLDASEALRRLASSVGSYRRLAIILRNVASVYGEDI